VQQPPLLPLVPQPFGGLRAEDHGDADVAEAFGEVDGLLGAALDGGELIQHQQQFHRVERRYGTFRRAITLPAQVQAEQIEASFEDGALQIMVPKAEEAKPKRIEVYPGGRREAIEATPPTS